MVRATPVMPRTGPLESLVVDSTPMSRNSRHVQQVQPVHRTGEGSPVTVQIVRHIESNGVSTEAIAVNLSEAPVPDRSYGADVFCVAYTRGVVNIYFGQTQASNPNGLHSLLAIRMTPANAHNFIASLTEAGPGMVQSIEATLLQLGVEPAEPFAIAADPAQFVKLTANFSLSAVSNGDACLDFMNASPFSMLAVQASQKLVIQPVVRIELASPQLLGLVGAMKSLQNTLPPPPKVTP